MRIWPRGSALLADAFVGEHFDAKTGACERVAVVVIELILEENDDGPAEVAVHGRFLTVRGLSSSDRRQTCYCSGSAVYREEPPVPARILRGLTRGVGVRGRPPWARRSVGLTRTQLE